MIGKSTRITYTTDGRAYLHIWRTGRSYARQKGALYRREWTNVLFSMEPQPPDETDVLYHDLRGPLPFADATFDAAYALHVIEHLTPAGGAAFIKELHRVLKPGAVVRISTPDMEDICRSYLQQLDTCRANRTHLNLVRYRWAVLELLDQLVRDQSGGLMSQACAAGDFDPEFARKRFGDVFDEFAPAVPGDDGRIRPTSVLKRLKALTGRSFLHGLRRRVRDTLDGMGRARPPENEALRIGELNRWMYDHLSLEMLLQTGGFGEYQRQDHRSSLIAGWEKYALDQSTHGPHPIEPSLYVEARKPR
jgi:SAM-dependent methyltransferase